MFRNIILLGMILAAASTAGWFTINREGDQTTIQINRSEIRSDATRAINRGREYLDQRDPRIAAQPNGDLGRQYDERQYQYPANQYPANQYPANQYPANQYQSGQSGQPQYYNSQYQPAGQSYPASQIYRGQEAQAYRYDTSEPGAGSGYGVPYQTPQNR